MDPTRPLLQHFLATLAYRTAKALNGAPPEFDSFQAGNQVRTPREIARHMATVLDFARSCFGVERRRPEPLASLDAEAERLHATIKEIGEFLQSDAPLRDGITPERLLQGPLADALTHAGQLALLRRLAGHPIPPENFAAADITASRLGRDQAAPVAPAASWPERLDP